MSRVLIVEDMVAHQDICRSVLQELEVAPNHIRCVRDRDTAIEHLRTSRFTGTYDLIILDAVIYEDKDADTRNDLKPERLFGLDVLQWAQSHSYPAPFIVLTQLSQPADYENTWYRTLDHGPLPADFLPKLTSPSTREVFATRDILKAKCRRHLVPFDDSDEKMLRDIEFFVGSPELRRAVKEAKRIATDTHALDPVLIIGPSGSGKCLMAKYMHNCSPRSGKPLVSVNCAAIPETLIESELFGFTKGAFTGASETHRGFFEQAEGGTLFLDEVDATTLSVQAKLLRVLQDSTIRPVGASAPKKVDVQVLFATNKDLVSEIRQNKFLPDLFARIAMQTVELPGLSSERRAWESKLLDITAHICGRLKDCTARQLQFEPLALRAMRGHTWALNHREVRQIALSLERSEARYVTLSDLPRTITAPAQADGALRSGGSELMREDNLFHLKVTIPGSGFDLEAEMAKLSLDIYEATIKRQDGKFLAVMEALGIPRNPDSKSDAGTLVAERCGRLVKRIPKALRQPSVFGPRYPAITEHFSDRSWYSTLINNPEADTSQDDAERSAC